MVAPIRGFIRLGNFVGLIIMIPFMSIFILVGISVLIAGILNYNTVKMLENTPIADIDKVKPGEVVKLYVTPNVTQPVYSSFSATPCVYYRTEDKEYYRSKNSLSSRVLKEVSAPASLFFKKNNVSYILPMDNPKPSVMMKITKTYLYNYQSNKYLPAITNTFSSGDKTIVENMLLNNEPVLIFGQLMEMQPAGENAKKLIFFQSDFANPFKNNPMVWLNSCIDIIKAGRPTLFLVSSKSIDEVKEKHNYMVCYFMMIFGLIFSGIPLIIVLTTVLNFMKKLSSGIN